MEVTMKVIGTTVGGRGNRPAMQTGGAGRGVVNTEKKGTGITGRGTTNLTGTETAKGTETTTEVKIDDHVVVAVGKENRRIEK